MILLCITIQEKPLLAVVGKVGCGKISSIVFIIIIIVIHTQSTLLQCLLKELPALSGTVIVKGSVGYAQGRSWVFIDGGAYYKLLTIT